MSLCLFNKLYRLVPSESAKLLINLKTLVLTGNEIEHLGAHDIGFQMRKLTQNINFFKFTLF